MNNIEQIVGNPIFRECLERNKDAEDNRIFCNHHFEHLLSTARLTYILILEENSPFITREMAYAAGLLHDIGRWFEYQSGADHAKKSSELAGTILSGTGFSETECSLIQKAIAQHRIKNNCHEHRSPLSTALAKADSLARTCFRCTVREQCNKLEEQPNRETLLY